MPAAWRPVTPARGAARRPARRVILYFLRHGAAEDRGRGSDGDRRLTRHGAERLRSAAAVWRRLNLRPDVILTSPLPRAAETAAIFAEAVGVAGRVAEDARLAPGADWGAMARSLADRPEAKRVMFVGHEPDLSNAISLLTGASSVRMRKGGLACIEFYGIPEVGTGEVAWLLDPDLYGD
jgi:phosphohistidine phosphatase